jgi:hypothetical protein
MSNKQPLDGGAGSTAERRCRRGMALAAVLVASLALAGTARAQATQGQAGEGGVLQAQAVPVHAAGNSIQTTAAVNAPVRALSPGNDAAPTARNEGGAGGDTASAAQTQTGADDTAQAQAVPVHAAGNSIQTTAAVNAPVRALSPGNSGSPTGGNSGAGGGGGGGSEDRGHGGSHLGAVAGGEAPALPTPRLTGAGGDLPFTGLRALALALCGVALAVAGGLVRLRETWR